MQRSNIFDFKNYLYFKLAVVIILIAFAAYLLFEPAVGHYGGSWLGYGLGTISALMVLWMAWYGVRKRRYRGSGATQGWLSAHIYLGTALTVIVTLHSGFHFGLNIHTFAYAMLLIVVISGFFGNYTYMIYPRQMTENMGEDNLDGLLLRIAESDKLARQIALLMPDHINNVVAHACGETSIGIGLLEQLRGFQPNCPSAIAVQQLSTVDNTLSPEQRKLYRDLYSIMVRRESLVRRARQDLMYRARLGFWLYFHVPFTIALLVAMLAHVIAVFAYW
ncbi:MAG: hypothetical protein Q8S46_02100 [Methylotenera sp.]|nr:hypothetical protein [Methylotenera sp.]MDO9232981.1 hypothetical protein [Methylotenera sp.]MDO9388956.1 hypothetical protein [Methylotenera sp.]MDP1595306.1 hypothetical protein [Methylotenera sp.]MDP1755255.1 hypothetical protein [Methylotenera sp.]